MHSSQKGLILGRDLLTTVAELEGAVSGYVRDGEAEPAAVLLDIAVAFPSTEWAYICGALAAQGAPPALVEARFLAYWPLWFAW